MPFRKWAVEPVFLCREPLPPDKNGCEFYTVTNVQLVNCLRQLSSIAQIAERIFDEIGSECRLVVERAQRLKEKVSVVQDVVENLNARAVKVPVSDLTQTARLLRHQKPYQTKYQKSTQLFLPSTRPPCIDRLYNAACPTPVAVICTIDKYRTDGLSSSELFMVTPILGGERKKKQKRYLDIETRKPANFSLARCKQDAVQSGSSSLPSTVPFTHKQNESLELERLPSPEEQAMMMSLEYPSTVVPVDTSGSSFNKMSLLRRSLIHADFVIKRKKNKRKSKRRHTFCEGQNREIEQAIRNVTNSSCQTDDLLDTTVSSCASINRSLSKRRSKSALDNSRRKTLLDELDSLQHDSKDSATEDDKEKSPSKASTMNMKKSKTISSFRSRSFNPISSLSAAISIAAVKMRNSTRGSGNKQDDGRSSSGNWSASSSTRASVDSDHQQTASPVDGVSSPSRNSIGKDSVLSDATQLDPHNRSRDEVLTIQSLTNSPIKRKKFGAMNLPWEPNHGNGRVSSTPTPDFTSQCSSTPVIRSPYAGRRGVSDDGDSSVYSVDTDGYYTSMHTDSGLWCNAITNMKLEDGSAEVPCFRQRQESQSSVSTIGNSSINSFLSKSATECSSTSGSFKRVGPDPPPRISSSISKKENNFQNFKDDQDVEDSDKSSSPQLQNGSASESDHEVGDRIRAKTAITANRYPSMCAVSPETSDDEISDSKRKGLSNVNVIIAEVHREEMSGDNHEITDTPDSGNKLKAADSPSSCSVNMYRSETPLPSNFSSSVCQNNNPLATSTPRSGINITTFSPDFNEIRNSKGGSYSRFRELDSNFDSDEELIVTECPVKSESDNDKSLIPLKYAQCITVTPVARSDSSNNGTGTIKRTPLKSYNSNTNNSGQEKPLIIPYNKKDSQPSYISFQAPDSPISSVSSFGRIPSCEKNLISPTNSLPRSVARVTLDPMGKVVYSSNSLGRVANLNANRNAVERTYATLPLCQNQTETKIITPLNQVSSSCKIDSFKPVKTNENLVYQTTVSKSESPLTTQSSSFVHNQNVLSPKPNTTVKHDFSFRPSRGGRFCRSYFPTHLISPKPASGNVDNSFPKATCSIAISENSVNYTISGNQHSTDNPAWQSYSLPSSQISDCQSKYVMHNRPIHCSSTVPNTESDNTHNSRLNSSSNSNIWPGRLYKSQDNNNCASVRLKPQSVNNSPPNTNSDINTKKSTSPTSFISLRPPDVIPSGESPPSTLDITSPAGSHRRVRTNSPTDYKEPDKTSPENDQKSLKAMSPSELFAIIHSSKKKHNIKTESEVSMSPMSSRSVSPALSQTSVSKIQPVETGILSKRSDPLSPDKTKWCNSMPSNIRKTNANDKLGPTKPTSMHDFKMLLLQTRTGVNDTNPRPSAAELLKVSPTKNSPVLPNLNSKSPVPLMFKSPISHYTSNPSYSPGHGTVPIKRNMRTRSPYLTRYDSAYPPIMEDCSEETESSYEDNKCLTSNPSFNQSPVYKMPDAVPQSTPLAKKATSTWV